MSAVLREVVHRAVVERLRRPDVAAVGSPRHCAQRRAIFAHLRARRRRNPGRHEKPLLLSPDADGDMI